MIAISSIGGVGAGAGFVARGPLSAFLPNRPDPVARSERVDRPDVEEYYRVRFSEVSLAAASPSSSGRRSPIERYLEIAAL